MSAARRRSAATSAKTSLLSMGQTVARAPGPMPNGRTVAFGQMCAGAGARSVPVISSH